MVLCALRVIQSLADLQLKYELTIYNPRMNSLYDRKHPSNGSVTTAPYGSHRIILKGYFQTTCDGAHLCHLAKLLKKEPVNGQVVTAPIT